MFGVRWVNDRLIRKSAVRARLAAATQLLEGLKEASTTTPRLFVELIVWIAGPSGYRGRGSERSLPTGSWRSAVDSNEWTTHAVFQGHGGGG